MTQDSPPTGPPTSAPPGPRTGALLLLVMVLGVGLGVVLDRYGVERLIQRFRPEKPPVVASQPTHKPPKPPSGLRPPASRPASVAASQPAWHVPAAFSLPPTSSKTTPVGSPGRRASLLTVPSALESPAKVPFLLSAEVTHQGQPLSCRVRLLVPTSSDASSVPLETVTDAEGRFSIALSEAGQAIISLYSNEGDYGTLLYQCLVDVPVKDDAWRSNCPRARSPAT